VANQDQMKEAIGLAYGCFGHIHGVIHAAGVAGGGIMQLKTSEMAARVLAPKVQGTIVLNALFQGRDLDFFILCSSMASILGGSGQVDYCGANAFLDAFAHHHNSGDGRLVVSIDWDTWQEVGMAVNTPVPEDLVARRQEALKRGILSSEGMDVFGRILGMAAPQVIVATRDFRSVIESNHAHPPLPAVEKPQEVTVATPIHSRPDQGGPYTAPRNKVEQTIAEVWQELLGIDRVGSHDNFFNLGGHSLTALQVLSRLRRAFQIDLSVRAILETPTVAGLAEVIERTRVVQEDDDLARTLAEVEALSEDEAKKRLDER
jgi:acyl carrier protein